MNYNLLGNRIRANKDKIIEMYKADTHIIDIAEEFGVVESTIHRHLRNWGVPLKRGAYKRRKKKVKKFKRKFSPELLAKFKENSRLSKGNIKYIKFENTTEDQRLISNILNHPIIG